MTPVKVPQFVRDDEIERIPVIAAGVNQIGEQHNEFRPAKTGGESIEEPAGLAQIDIGHFFQADAPGQFDNPSVEFRHLIGTELDGAAADMSDETHVREENK